MAIRVKRLLLLLAFIPLAGNRTCDGYDPCTAVYIPDTYQLLEPSLVGREYSDLLTLDTSYDVLSRFWTWESGTLPPGLVFDPRTGRIQGTPTTLGDYRFVVNLRVGLTYAGCRCVKNVRQTARIGIFDNIAITSESPLRSVAFGRYYNVAIATTGDPVQTVTLVEGRLPDGLRLDEGYPDTGNPFEPGYPRVRWELMSDLPLAESGTFVFTLEARGLLATTHRKTFELTICDELGKPVPLPPGTVGVKYTAQAELTSGTVVSWNLIFGSTLPPGLSLSPSGVITGLPQTAGVYTFELRGTDECGGSEIRRFKLTIGEAGPI